MRFRSRECYNRVTIEVHRELPRSTGTSVSHQVELQHAERVPLQPFESDT